ncbi:hypothetical protein [Streptomyces sp. NPDC058653]|uniref:hypothetical protein n=1 Tax=Streptomyces sp. NPDC058653 TaxID=3346576 RepID=UPI00365FE449
MSQSQGNEQELPAQDMAGEEGPSLYRVEAENAQKGARRSHHVRAGSMTEAATLAREANEPSGAASDGEPLAFRVVAITEENATSRERERRNARRQHIRAMVEAGLSALGRSAPEHPDGERADVLVDFFTRAVCSPGRFPFPAGEGEGGVLLASDDAARVLAQLLTAHLARHGLTVTRTAPA